MKSQGLRSGERAGQSVTLPHCFPVVQSNDILCRMFIEKAKHPLCAVESGSILHERMTFDIGTVNT
jgi:hypothetical protein